MDFKFLQINKFSYGPFGVIMKVGKDICVVTRNLSHRNPEWNLTADVKVCSRCCMLLEKEPLLKQMCKQISSSTSSINLSNLALQRVDTLSSFGLT